MYLGSVCVIVGQYFCIWVVLVCSLSSIYLVLVYLGDICVVNSGICVFGWYLCNICLFFSSIYIFVFG